MKKRIVIILSILFAVTLTACGGSNLFKNSKISELRVDILVGENDTYKVLAVTGMREEPFNIDGKSNESKAYFTVITVTPAEFSPLSEYTFSVTINGQLLTGKLLRHPFNQTYSTEIGLLNKENSLTVTVNDGSEDSVITATSIKTENFIDENKAFSIAEKKLKSKVSAKDSGYELFIRLIENPLNADGGYYWYVAYMFSDDSTLAVLIDPVTMEIVAVRD